MVVLVTLRTSDAVLRGTSIS